MGGWRTLLLLLALVVKCHCQTILQPVCPMDKQMTVIEPTANVVIGGLFDIRSQGVNGTGCGNPLPDTMQVFEAARFAVNLLNSYNNGNGYISGVKFGLQAYDTCFSSTNALGDLQKLYPQSTSANPFCTSTTQVIPGVVGPLSSATAVSSATLAGQLQVGLISPAATAPELSDKIKYPTFLRTVPSFAAFAKVITELLRQQQWQNILVVYTDEAYGRTGYEELLKATYSQGLCVSQAVMLDISGNKDTYKAALGSFGVSSSPAAVLLAPNSLAKVILQAVDEVPALAEVQWVVGDLDITNDASSLRRARGALVVVPRSPSVADFKQFFLQLESNPRNNVGNPWFSDWFQSTYGCSLTSNTCPSAASLDAIFMQSPWAVPTMKAVFAYAEAVRTCPSSSGGQCSSSNSSAFITALRSLDFTLPNNFPSGLQGQRVKFDANGDPDTSDFTVYNYNNRLGSYRFEEIGYFTSNNLSLTGSAAFYDSQRNTILTTAPTATCAKLGCEYCLLPKRSVTFRYNPGNLVIASLINAHEDSSAPYTCGSGQMSQLAALVAAEWAVAQYKSNNPGQLQNVSLGSLVADVCPDAAVAEGFLTDLLSGSNKLMDASGGAIPSSNIQAFVNGINSGQTLNISPIIADYNRTEVQTSITTAEVTHGADTPYFIRAVPRDTVIYSAVSNFLQRRNANFVQIVTYRNGEYRHMADTFKRVAAEYGICILNTVAFDDGIMDPYNGAVASLLSNLKTSVVVFFGGKKDLQGLLNNLQLKGKIGQLQFVAGVDNWGRDPSFIQGLGTSAGSSVVFDLELTNNTGSLAYMTAFNSYLQGLSLQQIAANPFLRELFELSNQCAVAPTSLGMYSRGCTSTDRLQLSYQGKVPYVIQSINTVASKLHEILVELCGTGYSGLCASFLNVTDIGSRLSAKLTDVQEVNGYGISKGESTTDLFFYVYTGDWTRFAVFNTVSQTFTEFLNGSLPVYSSSCAGVCTECQYLFNMQPHVYSMGNWLIGGMFGVSNTGGTNRQPFICGGAKTVDGPQFTTAMLYALDQVNKGQAPVSVKGVTFGGLIFDHCDDPERAELIMSDLYLEGTGVGNGLEVDERSVLAWITDDSASTNKTLQILDPLGVTTVSPSATADDLLNYPTFFRTVQGDGAVAQALISIVKVLKASFVQVVYSADVYGRANLNTLSTIAQTKGVCILSEYEFSSNNSNITPALTQSTTSIVILFLREAEIRSLMSTLANDATATSKLLILLPEPFKEIVQLYGGKFKFPILSLELPTFDLPSYTDYINSAATTNPYFQQYYMQVMRCNLPGFTSYTQPCSSPPMNITSSTNYRMDSYVLPTIDAVYAVVGALHLTVSEYCGSNYSQPCSSFMAAKDKRSRFNYNLNNINFYDGQKLFIFQVREGISVYNILQGNSSGNYIKVGSYSSQSLDIDDGVLTSYTSVVSDCPDACLGCIMKYLNFSLTPGDIYLAGLFDVHESSLSPFTCGNLKSQHGFLLLEAFHYALDQVNGKQGQFSNILPGVTLGGVGLDTCESAVRGGYIISNVHSGLVTLAKDNQVIMPSTIDTYIGTYTSYSSMYTARILNDLMIPQISYGAGSEDLSDSRWFPYFYRTVPSDKNQVEVILKLLDKLNIRYVQVLFEDNTNGISAKDYFLKTASNYSVCVAQTVAYPDLSTVSSEISNAVVTELTQIPTANTIVTFLSTDYIYSVLVAVSNSAKAKNKFRFVGSDSWADNQEAIRGVEDQAKDSITVRLNADNIQDFEIYINSKNLANSKNNPWFEEYFQKTLNCYISQSNTMGYPIHCPSGPVNIINSPLYQQESGVVYVINAVYAAAFAIHDTLVKQCGVNYTTVCQAYRSDSSHRDMIRDNLANVSFVDPAGRNFSFIDRAGQTSFRFQSINSGFLSYTYKPIGYYNVSTMDVSISDGYQFNWNSDCNRPDACAECPAIRNTGKRYVYYNQGSPTTSVAVVAFFDIHKQGVEPFRCGDINAAGFLQLMTFVYALDKLVPNTNVRVLVIDTCSNSLRVDQDLFGLLMGTGLCNTEFDNSMPISLKNLGSVITAGDMNTLAASRVLELPGVTYLSPNSLSTMLDNKQHLVRTIAPISAVLRTLAAFLEKIGWSYLDVVYENSAEGVEPFRSFASFANLERVCRGSSIMVPASPSSSDVRSSLSRLNGNLGSGVVVLFGSPSFVKLILSTAKDMAIADNYIWVLANEWQVTLDVLKDLAPVGVQLRLIAIQRLMYQVGAVQDYVNAQSIMNTPLNIPRQWIDEFFQQVFDCRLVSSSKPMNPLKAACNTTRTLASANLTLDAYTLNLYAAAYTAVMGLKGFMAPLNESLDRARILQQILNLETDLNAAQLSLSRSPPLLKFDQAYQWWDSGYLIRWIKVMKRADGSADISDSQLINGVFSPTEKDVNDMVTTLGVTSVCNDPATDCNCVYETIEQPQQQISEPFKPSEPRNYYYYNSSGEKQYEWPIWAIVVAILTSIGILATIILFLILIIAYPIRGGTTVLGYMSIVGILGIYAINFAFFVHATEATCGARRFLMGVVYMIALAPLLIKAVDNWRWTVKLPPPYQSYMSYDSDLGKYRGIFSPFGLFLGAVSVVLFQCIIPIMWLILVHPTASDLSPYSFSQHDNFWCDPPQDYDTGMVQSFIFVMFIILVTAIFAALTFESDRNNNESRYILFCCISTAGCFLVWMIVSTSAGPPYRDPAVAIGNLINATLLLIAFPLRKTTLVFSSKRQKGEKEDEDLHQLQNGNGAVMAFNDAYDNPMFESDYDNQFGAQMRPAEY